MAEKKEHLQKLYSLVNQVANEPGNEWFKNELATNFGKTESKDKLTYDIKNDTTKIVKYLEVNPSCSIDFSFIEHKLLRTRLELDNLRMENVRYDLKEKDEMKRLYDFCVNAFYQIENLINFYYFEKYPKIEDLLTHLETVEKTTFKRKNENNLGDITIATKIYSFTKTQYNSDSEVSIGMNINSLRLIRNEGLHRCTRIKNIESENKTLHQFIKFATFDSIHSVLNSLTKKIKNILQETPKINKI